MEAKSLHFTGETVVWRGPWHMDIPMDFHLVINPDANPKLQDKAAMVIAQFLSEQYVKEQEALCIISDNDDDEELPTY